MPFALLFIGTLLLVSGVRNTEDDLFSLVKGDFTGKNNFIYWIVALLAVGSLGYVPRIKPFANAMLALIIVVIFLRNGAGDKGFFAQFTDALNSTQKPASETSNNTSQPAVNSGAKSLDDLFPGLGNYSAIIA